MKFTVSVLEKRSEGTRRPWSHLFGGRVRTSTLVLIIAFFAIWWVYDTYRPQPPDKPSPQQVVPSGFVPDPNYTWVPRSRVQEPPPTVSFTPTSTSTVPPTPTATVPITTTTAAPPFTPPCLLPAPFCPPSASPTAGPGGSPPQRPQPGPGSAPSSPPPAS